MRCTAVHSPMNTTDPQPVGLPPIWSAGECGYKMLSITEIKCEQARNGDPRCTTPLHYTVLGHTYPLLSTNFPDNQSIIWMRVIQFARTGTYLESFDGVTDGQVFTNIKCAIPDQWRLIRRMPRLGPSPIGIVRCQVQKQKNIFKILNCKPWYCDDPLMP